MHLDLHQLPILPTMACSNNSLTRLFCVFIAFIVSSLSLPASTSPLKARTFQRAAELSNYWIISNLDSTTGFAAYWYDPQEDQHFSESSLNALSQTLWVAHLARQRTNFSKFHDLQIQTLEDIFDVDFGTKPQPQQLTSLNLYHLGILLRTLSVSPYQQNFQFFVAGVIEALDAQFFGSNITNYQHIFATQVEYEEESSESAHLALALFEVSRTYKLKRAEELGSQIVSTLIQISNRESVSHNTLFLASLAEALSERARIREEKDDWMKILSIALEILKLQDKENFPGSFEQPKLPGVNRSNSARDARLTQTLMLGLEAALRANNLSDARALRKGVSLGVENLMTLQYRSGFVNAFANPLDVLGSVRFYYNETRCRLDGTILFAETLSRASALALKGYI